MHLVGIVEIVAGLIVLSRWTAVGAYIVSWAAREACFELRPIQASVAAHAWHA